MTKPATTVETIATRCIAGRLRLLNRVITNLYDDALRPFGLKLSQANILAITAKLGVARAAQVCDILELDTSTLSRAVDRMVDNGWLEILPDEDGRSHPFRLTDEGRLLMEQTIPAWDRVQAEANTLLGEDGLRLLDETIRRIKVDAGRLIFFGTILVYTNIGSSTLATFTACSFRGSPADRYRRRSLEAACAGLRGRRRGVGRDRACGLGRPAGRHPEVLPQDEGVARHRLPDESGANPQPGSFGGEPGVSSHGRGRQRGLPGHCHRLGAGRCSGDQPADGVPDGGRPLAGKDVGRLA